MKKNCNLVEIPKKTGKEASVKQLYKSKKIEKNYIFLLIKIIVKNNFFATKNSRF